MNTIVATHGIGLAARALISFEGYEGERMYSVHGVTKPMLIPCRVEPKNIKTLRLASEARNLGLNVPDVQPEWDIPADAVFVTSVDEIRETLLRTVEVNFYIDEHGPEIEVTSAYPDNVFQWSCGQLVMYWPNEHGRFSQPFVDEFCPREWAEYLPTEWEWEETNERRRCALNEQRRAELEAELKQYLGEVKA